MATGSIEFPFSQEIVDLICSHLHEKRDIQSARLVCRAFNAAARGFFYSAGQSPSLLFGDIRTDFLSESAALASSEAFVEPGNYTPEAFTLWTWLDVPANINFEDPLDDVGNTFTKLLIEPFDSKLNPGAKLNHGRKGICWGRIKDSPNSFCIVTSKLSTMRDTRSYLANKD